MLLPARSRGQGCPAAAACVLKPCSSTCPGTGTAQARPLLGDSSRAYTQPTHGAHAPSSAPSWRLPDSTRPSSQDPLLPPAAHTGRAGARSHAHLQPCTLPGPADSRTDAPSPSCSAPAAQRRTRVPLERGRLGQHSCGQRGGGSAEHARLLCFAARRQAAGKRPRSGPGAAAASSRRAGGAPWGPGPLGIFPVPQALAVSRAELGASQGAAALLPAPTCLSLCPTPPQPALAPPPGHPLSLSRCWPHAALQRHLWPCGRGPLDPTKWSCPPIPSPHSPVCLCLCLCACWCMLLACEAAGHRGHNPQPQLLVGLLVETPSTPWRAGTWWSPSLGTSAPGSAGNRGAWLRDV